MSASKTIILIIQYFGPFPDWIDLYIEGCRRNPDIDWLIFTDQTPPENIPPNVQFRVRSLSDHCAEISKNIGVNFQPMNGHKLCDIRPMTGAIFSKSIAGYDYFGYGDIDLIYGRLRDFLDPALRRRPNIFSSHSHLLSGHFALLKNTWRMRNAFRLIKGWKDLIMSKESRSVDEYFFTPIFGCGEYRKLWGGRHSKRRGCVCAIAYPPRRNIFSEQFSTPMSRFRPWTDGSFSFPSEWFWKDGRLTNDKDGEREFMYLHFMHWRHNKYSSPDNKEAGSWSSLPSVMQTSSYLAIKNGFSISRFGIQLLPARIGYDPKQVYWNALDAPPPEAMKPVFDCPEM